MVTPGFWPGASKRRNALPNEAADGYSACSARIRATRSPLSANHALAAESTAAAVILSTSASDAQPRSVATILISTACTSVNNSSNRAICSGVAASQTPQPLPRGQLLALPRCCSVRRLHLARLSRNRLQPCKGSNDPTRQRPLEIVGPESADRRSRRPTPAKTPSAVDI